MAPIERKPFTVRNRKAPASSFLLQVVRKVFRQEIAQTGERESDARAPELFDDPLLEQSFLVDERIGQGFAQPFGNCRRVAALSALRALPVLLVLPDLPVLPRDVFPFSNRQRFV